MHKMNEFEERVAEEVRRYPHSYNSNLDTHRDSGMQLNSWREIAQSVYAMVDGKLDNKLVKDTSRILRNRLANVG